MLSNLSMLERVLVKSSLFNKKRRYIKDQTMDLYIDVFFRVCYDKLLKIIGLKSSLHYENCSLTIWRTH